MQKKSKSQPYVSSRLPSGVEVHGSAQPTRFRFRRMILALAGFLVLLIIAFFIAFCASACSQEAPSENTSPEEYASPYSWANLRTDSHNRLYYVNAAGETTSLCGIDVSEWDTDTDWSAVAADGVQFAFIRVGYRGMSEGGLYEDGGFRTNYTDATANGIQVGVYFYSQALNPIEAREEADFILGILNGATLDLPIVYDHEGAGNTESRCYGMSDADYSACAQAFCNRIEHGGYSAMIYGNRAAIARLSSDISARYSIWFAEWDTDEPHLEQDFSIWQYTSEGAVAGMWRQVDTSIWFTEEVPLITPDAREAARQAAIEAGTLAVYDWEALKDQLTDKSLPERVEVNQPATSASSTASGSAQAASPN